MPVTLTRRTAMVTGACALIGPTGVRAADYPSRSIKIVIPWATGGAGDVVIRLLAPSLGQRLGQPIVVDNRPGATGSIGSAAVARSAPDGYTLVYAGADSHSIFPHLTRKPPYQFDDFTAVAPIAMLPYVLAVHPAVSATDAPGLVQAMRKAAQPLAVGSWGTGSSAHILAEEFKSHAKADLLHVPYQGAAPLMAALMAGQVSLAILPVPLVEQHARAGTIRVLGAVARNRLSGMPDVPTLAEQGVPMASSVWIGVLGPAGLPGDVTARLYEAFDATVSDPAVASALGRLNFEPQRMPLPAYQPFLRAEYERWGGVIRQARVSID